MILPEIQAALDARASRCRNHALDHIVDTLCCWAFSAFCMYLAFRLFRG